MWTSERNRNLPLREAAAELGTVTLGGDPAGVSLGGERRWLTVYGPGGYSWRPTAGDKVLVLKAGAEGESPCVLGTVQGTEELRPGEVRLAGGENTAPLRRDGLLLGREQGPRLYLFLDALDKKDYLPLLDFSYPQTQEEMDLDAKASAPVEEEEPEAVYGDPDPVADFKPSITLDQFNTIDLRVCKVLKCQEIRKARNNYKLTLFDGRDKRVIVSSLKGYYKPEQLEGRKIIVIANLEPARLTGVTSEGMLLAATNNACGCKVIFVDDSVPEGTAIR